MKVTISPRAEKQFRKLPKFDQIAISQKIQNLFQEMNLNESKLSGYNNIFRIRVGVYRIVYRKQDGIYVILIGHRKEVYKLLKDVLR